MRQVIIMRGIPGSGKSRFVKETLLNKHFSGRQTLVCSADDFFMVGGQYKFSPALLPQAHNNCFMKFFRAVSEDNEIMDTVVIDNTNSRRWEYDHYIEIAVKYGWIVSVYEMFCPTLDKAAMCAERNSHNVPFENVIGMWRRWEQDKNASFVNVQR